MMIYLQAILVPYIEKVRAELNDRWALVIFESWPGLLATLERNSISFWEYCTDHLQPLDFSVNKPVKDHLKTVSKNGVFLV